MQMNLKALDVNPDNLVFTLQENSRSDLASGEQTHNDQTAPLFLNRMLLDAVKAGASDIHFEPFEQTLRIRLRVDGVMQEINNLPVDFGRQLIIRLKVIAGLDISEHYGTQSGRFRMLLDDATGLDFRCSITPTLYGETVVLRLLYLPTSLLDLSILGLTDTQINQIQHASQRLQGMILVTGPTGSGKTTTVYSMLQSIGGESRNIVSIEDPVEFGHPYVRQLSVDLKHEISMNSGLRTILRMDPDVLFIGEIRDCEAAQIGMRAASSGKYVFSSLHTRDIVSTITSLRNLGIENRSLAGCLSGIINQRLARRLCSACKSVFEASPEQRDKFTAIGLEPPAQLYNPVGCEKCRGTGFHGRIGVFELSHLTAEFRKGIEDNLPASELDAILRAGGVRRLEDDALSKAGQGLIRWEDAIEIRWLA